MKRRFLLGWSAAAMLAMSLSLAARPAAMADTPLAFDSAKVTIAGTSNIHEYTASTTTARLVRLQLAAGTVPTLQALVTPGVVQAFEIAIPAATLTSEKDGLDKNMHKALKVTQHPEITFRLSRVEGDATGALKGIGILRIAGVDREIGLTLTTQRSAAGITVTGQVPLLMTDFAIEPPKAMLGMLKTDPKVTVTFEIVLGLK